MLDQSFSVENFGRIFDYENRKGVFLEKRYFESLWVSTSLIKDQHSLLKVLKSKRASLPESDYLSQKHSIDAEIERLKAIKETLLNQELELVSQEIHSKEFKFELITDTIKAKTVYKAHQNPSSYFAIKQIQYNLRKLFKVKQSNRYQIICQLREILSDKLNKVVIRTDIKECYESIPTSKLLKFLNQDTLLSLLSKKLIKRLISSYRAISGSETGLPRGVGVSAYLAEIYLRKLDEQVRNLPNVLYYSRYVDDIVVVFKKIPNESFNAHLDSIRNCFEKMELVVNEDKTKECSVNGSTIHKFEYLGYKIQFGQGSIEIKLAQKKFNKYKKRIDLAFELFVDSQIENEKLARKELEKRLKFLTGNTNLVNNKSHIKTGIYFSNSLITDISQLTDLDDHLQLRVNAGTYPPRFKARLNALSFKKGFEEKTFYKFSVQDLKDIMRGWKNAS